MVFRWCLSLFRRQRNSWKRQFRWPEDRLTCKNVRFSFFSFFENSGLYVLHWYWHSGCHLFVVNGSEAINWWVKISMFLLISPVFAGRKWVHMASFFALFSSYIVIQTTETFQLLLCIRTSFQASKYAIIYEYPCTPPKTHERLGKLQKNPQTLLKIYDVTRYVLFFTLFQL